MIVFFINLSKPRIQALKPNAFAIRHLSRSSEPEKVVRVRDSHFDDYMEVLKKTRKVLKFKSLIMSRPNNTVPVAHLSYITRDIDFETSNLFYFILNHPHVFEIYNHPVQRILFCRFTRKALAQFQLEREALLDQLSEAVTRLRKILMMSKTRRLWLHMVLICRVELGLPDDLETSVILKHPEFFYLGNADRQYRHKYVQSTEDESDRRLRVCAIERVREREYRERGVDSEATRFSFMINYPPRFLVKRKDAPILWRWQRDAYWSPYEDVSRHDMRSSEARRRMEKRAVAVIHELLSITVEKRLTLERIAHFRDVYDLPTNLLDFLLKYQGIFYISTRGNHGKIHMVFLREAYCRGRLIVPNDLYLARMKLGQLCIMRTNDVPLEAELLGMRMDQERRGYKKADVKYKHDKERR